MSLDTLLIIIVLLGAFAGAFMFFRSPHAYIAFGTIAIEKLKPVIFAYLLKRMSPEKEKEFRDCMRRGGEWDHVRKRCKR